MLVEFGVWLKHTITGPKINKPRPKELDEYETLGFGIGAIILKPNSDKDVDIYNPENWCVISEIDITPRLHHTHKQPEFFKVKPIVGFTSFASGYCINELTLIQPSPNKKTIDIIIGMPK